jgi:hypothetical protein
MPFYKKKCVFLSFVYLGLFFFLLLIFSKYLLNWTINGDELYTLSAVKNYPIKLIFENFIKIGSGHYQPLITPVAIFLSYFLPSFQLVHLVNFAVFTFIPLLVFLNINLFFPVIISLLLTTVFILSSFFYYHIFAISGIANTLMLITNLLMIYILLKKFKNKIFLASIIFIISVFIKETFIVNFFILTLIIFTDQKKSLIKTLKNLAPIGIFVFLYFFVRLRSFGPDSDPNYAFVLTLSKSKENLLLIVPWLFNYPRGWQYGVPLPKPLIISFAILINFVAIIFLYLNLFLKKIVGLIIIIAALLITLLPYLFLNRILVHHIDNTYLVFFTGIIFSLYLLYKQKKGLAKLLICLLFVSNLILFSFTLPQWTKYSFVGVSNETAQNYINILNKSRAESYDRICIINHDKGSWPTADGKLAEFIIKKPIAIVSTKSQKVSATCKNNKTLILKNDERNYLKVAFK